MNHGQIDTTDSKYDIAVVFHSVKNYHRFLRNITVIPKITYYPFHFGSLLDLSFKLRAFKIWFVEEPRSSKIKYRLKTRAQLLGNTLIYFDTISKIDALARSIV